MRGEAWHGQAWQGEARPGKARRGLARHGKAWYIIIKKKEGVKNENHGKDRRSNSLIDE